MGIESLQNPSAAAPRHMTYWVKEPEAGVSKPGVHYHVIEELNNHPDYVVFPDIPVLRNVFRHAWVLRRSSRPFVPQPDGAPMPDRAKTIEDRSRLFSIYLRPWVLERSHVCKHVPHITCLDVVVRETKGSETNRRRIQRKQSMVSPASQKSYVSSFVNSWASR
jgi:hypothetical protein